MKDHYEYKGYLGSAEVDIESNVLVGKLLFISDVIAYSASTLGALEKAFKEAVDEYLSTCGQLGEQPDTPCKGSFNVRIGQDIHREVALAARAKGMGLNEFVRQALTAAVSGPARQLVEHVHKHEHEHNVIFKAEKTEHIATYSIPAKWESAYAAH